MSKTGYYYRSKIKDDSQIIDALNQQVEVHPQEGFWLSYYRFRNQGKVWNHKCVYRIYKMMGLGIRRKKKKRLPAQGLRNHYWFQNNLMILGVLILPVILLKTKGLLEPLM